MSDESFRLRRLMQPRKAMPPWRSLPWLEDGAPALSHLRALASARIVEAIDMGQTAAILAREIWEEETTQAERALAAHLNAAEQMRWLFAGTETTGREPEFAAWRAARRQRELAAACSRLKKAKFASEGPLAFRERAARAERRWRWASIPAQLLTWGFRGVCLLWLGETIFGATWFGHRLPPETLFWLGAINMARAMIEWVKKKAVGDVASLPKWWASARELPLAWFWRQKKIQRQTRKTWRALGVERKSARILTAINAGEEDRSARLRDPLAQALGEQGSSWMGSRFAALRKQVGLRPATTKPPSAALAAAAKRIRENCALAGFERTEAERERAEIKKEMLAAEDRAQVAHAGPGSAPVQKNAPEFPPRTARSAGRKIRRL